MNLDNVLALTFRLFHENYSASREKPGQDWRVVTLGTRFNSGSSVRPQEWLNKWVSRGVLEDVNILVRCPTPLTGDRLREKLSDYDFIRVRTFRDGRVDNALYFRVNGDTGVVAPQARARYSWSELARILSVNGEWEVVPYVPSEKRLTSDD